MTDGVGNYSITVSVPLLDGSYGVDATSTDTIGNLSLTTSRSFTIDTTAPITPTIATPINNSLISDTTPTLTGTGEENTVFVVRNA